MLSFVGTNRTARGTDVISDFLSGTDKTMLSKAIWAEVRGKPITEYSIGDTGDDEGTNLTVPSVALADFDSARTPGFSREFCIRSNSFEHALQGATPGISPTPGRRAKLTRLQ